MFQRRKKFNKFIVCLFSDECKKFVCFLLRKPMYDCSELKSIIKEIHAFLWNQEMRVGIQLAQEEFEHLSIEPSCSQRQISNLSSDLL